MATIAIHDDANELVFASDPDDPMCAIEVPEGGGIVRFHFPEVPLLDGTYSVSVGVRSATETAIFDWKDQVTKFEVANPGRSTGRVRLPLDVSFRLAVDRPDRRGAGGGRRVLAAGPAGLGGVDGVTAVTRIDQVIPTLASRDAIGGHVDAAPGPAALPRLPVGHLLRQRLAGPARRGLPDHPDRRPAERRTGPALPALHRQRRGRHLPRPARAQVRELPQHHPGRPARGLDPRGRRGGPVGAGPAARPGPGDRVRHRRLRATTSASCATPATGRPRRSPCSSTPRTSPARPTRRWPPGWRASGPAGGRRPAVRGQGLAPQGPARPGQGPGRLPAALRPRRPACTSWAAPSARSTSDAVRAVRRRAGPGRRRGDAPGRSPTRSSSPTTSGCDVFLCLSNHEGFCVPLLESMYHRLPIVSYRSTAVPETVQQAGLILPDKEPARVAAAIHRVVEDERLRAELAARRRPSGSTGSPCRGSRTGSSPPSRPPARRDRGRDLGHAGPVGEDRLRRPPLRPRHHRRAPRRPPGCWPSTSSPARGWDVDVLTTCAEDFVTWDDVYRRGEEWIAGVRVVRFRSAAGREPSFHPLSAALLADPAAASTGDAERWLDLQGPVTPDLADAAAGWDGDAMVFYPYLYYPTVRVIGRVTGADHPPPGRPRRAGAAPAGLPPGVRGGRRPGVPDRGRAPPGGAHVPGGQPPPAPARPGGRRPRGRPGPPTPATPAARPAAPVPDGPFLVCLGRVDGHKGTTLLAALLRPATRSADPGPLRLVLAGPVVDAPAAPRRHRRRSARCPRRTSGRCSSAPRRWCPRHRGRRSRWSWPRRGAPGPRSWSMPGVRPPSSTAGGRGRPHLRRVRRVRGGGRPAGRRRRPSGGRSGTRGRAYVDARFRWPHVIDRYAAFVESVVARAARATGDGRRQAGRAPVSGGGRGGRAAGRAQPRARGRVAGARARSHDLDAEDRRPRARSSTPGSRRWRARATGTAWPPGGQRGPVRAGSAGRSGRRSHPVPPGRSGAGV